MLRIGLLDHFIRQGVLLPRWTPNLLLGYGYPLYNFYAPLSYYLAESLHLLGLGPYAAFIVAFAILILAAGLGMYRLALDIFGPERPECALVAATAYLYAPYLLTNVYIRGAIAEAAAQALLPWILWSARRLMRQGQPARYALPLALTLGGLALTHNITLLFLPPLLLGYLAVHWLLGGRNWTALCWALFALLGAMGISAFFWLPLLLERAYVAGTGYEIARSVWLPSSVWRWHNFLDGGLTFEHTFARPIRLGLVQLVLAVAGFALARRRDAEWLFVGAVALLTGLSMGAWALPLWQSNDILPVAQFTWRLLSILSLLLALFTGAILVRLPHFWLRAAMTTALLALVLYSSQPRLDWMDVFSPDSVDVSLPIFAQAEIEKGAFGGGEGNSSIQEFRPRWAARSLVLQPIAERASDGLDLALDSASPYMLAGAYTSATSRTLRFTNFYFPGWRILLDGETQLAPYPSTNLGLLTVDLPAGAHRLEVTWTETPVQRWGGLVSLAALALCIVAMRQAPRPLLLFAGLLCLVGLVAQVTPVQQTDLVQPQAAVEYEGLRLLGYRLEQSDTGALIVYPYWYVQKTPPVELRARWTIENSDGRPLAGVTSYPYFNTSSAANWPPNTLVDDGYRLALPPGLPAGEYRLALRLGARDAELDQPPLVVGAFALAQTVEAQTPPLHPVDVRIGESVRLAGYELRANGRGADAPPEKPAVVHSGDYLEYLLNWQATGPVDQNYHGFVHLLDHNGQPLVQQDQLPGPFFRPPRLWDESTLQTDVYLLRLPANAPSGLYWPTVGLYEFESLKRLPVYLDGSSEPGDHVRLPAIKIVNPQAPQPEHRLAVRVGELATLVGYDLALPEQGLHAGEHFAVTLYFRSEAATDREYIRFLQLYQAERGMAAQLDSPPQAGGNPIWSWQPGEVIVDRVELQVSEEAVPGVYTLYTGFYDAQDPTARLPIRDETGIALPDGWFPVTEIEVAPDDSQ
jgi:hypothetical protein